MTRTVGTKQHLLDIFACPRSRVRISLRAFTALTNTNSTTFATCTSTARTDDRQNGDQKESCTSPAFTQARALTLLNTGDISVP